MNHDTYSQLNVTDLYKDYKDYSNPLVSDLLWSLGIRKCFTRANGHTIEFKDASDRPGSLLDFAAGYGTLLWGHNHPEIRKTIQEFLDSDHPIHTQFSVRYYSTLLAKKLCQIAQKYTNQEYICRFSNSGAETVDLALKHCEFRRVLKMQKLLENNENTLLQLERDYDLLEIKIPASLFAGTELREQIFDEYLTPQQLRGFVSRLNAKALQARPMIFCLKKGFHGKTIAASQATHAELYRRAFMYFGMFVFFLDPENILEMEMIMDDCKETFYKIERSSNEVTLVEERFPLVTGVLVEPIQGEGGIKVLSDHCLHDLRMICDAHEIPLIFDEIQCGMGRTGKFFASEHSGVNADIYLIAKALGGGYAKIGAALIRKDQYQDPFGIIHTSTFGEDEFSSAIGCKVLDMLERDNGAAYQKATALGNRIMEGLHEISKKYPGVIKEIRGIGLMIGMEFNSLKNSDSTALRNLDQWKISGYTFFSFLQENFNIRALPTASAPNTVRLEPGICLEESEIKQLLFALEKLTASIYHADGLQLVRQIASQRRNYADPAQAFDVIPIGSFSQQATSASNVKIKSNEPIQKIGFLGHIMDVKSLDNLVPEFQRFSIEDRLGLYRNSSDIRLSTSANTWRVRGNFGNEIEVKFYVMNRTAEQLIQLMMGKGKDDLDKALKNACLTARKDGCTMLGFGGFTSIVSTNCKDLPIVPGLAYTSGNSLTTGLGVEAIWHGAAKKGLDPANCTAAIIGAAGNIGQVFASLISEKVQHLLLIGSGRKGSSSRLSKTSKRIYQNIADQLLSMDKSKLGCIASRVLDLPEVRDEVARQKDAFTKESVLHVTDTILASISKHFEKDPFVTLSDDLTLISQAQLVVCVSNAAAPFIGNQHICSGAVVCDIGVPANVMDEVTKRDDIEFSQGGLAQLPFQQRIPSNTMNIPEGLAFGCLTETIVLGMLGAKNSYSVGDISCNQVNEILGLSKILGFNLADTYRTGPKF